jgi:uncharacterized protein YcbK (DUF882 family)
MSKKHIAPYILYKEYQCSHCRKLPPMFYDTDGQRKGVIPYVYNEFFDIFREIREKWGRAIPITSGYRCIKHQRDLYDQGVSSAILSVHMFGLALDLDCSDEYEVRSLVRHIRQVCPELRMGWEAYLHRGQSFVHIDCGYMIYPPYSKKLYRGASW